MTVGSQMRIYATKPMTLTKTVLFLQIFFMCSDTYVLTYINMRISMTALLRQIVANLVEYLQIWR